MSRSCCTNEHILVPTGEAARQNECCKGRCELARENSHQAFIGGAFHGRSGHAHLQATCSHACEAFRRGARTNAQAKQKIGALDGAPGLIDQRSRMSNAWM